MLQDAILLRIKILCHDKQSIIKMIVSIILFYVTYFPVGIFLSPALLTIQLNHGLHSSTNNRVEGFCFCCCCYFFIVTIVPHCNNLKIQLLCIKNHYEYVYILIDVSTYKKNQMLSTYLPHYFLSWSWKYKAKPSS